MPSRRHFLRLSGLAAVGACATPPGKTSDTDPTDPDYEVPRITPNDEFYVTSYAGTPDIDPDTWRLDLDGQATIGLAELDALTPREKEHTLVCIGSSDRYRAMGNALWTGLPLRELLDAFGVVPADDAIEIHFRSADDYQTAIPITDLDDREIWLVWRMNGAELPPEHGYPARLLVPNRYGMKNPKWITSIAFAKEALVGTWEAVGWSNDCTIKPTTWAHVPEDRSEVATDTVHLAGSAFCGSVAIERVEVSADDGDTWMEASEVTTGPQDTWTTWVLDWTPPGPGDYTLLVRTTAADGRASDPDFVSDASGFGGYDTLTVTVL